MSTDLDPNVVSNNAARAYEAETKRIEAVAAASLTYAKSSAIDEHTREQFLSNVLKARSIQEYEQQLGRMHAERSKHAVEVKRLTEAAAALSHYKLGHRIADVHRYSMWAAYRVLTDRAPVAVLTTWAGIAAPGESTDPNNWIGRTTSGAPHQVTVPHPENVADLLGFQSDFATTVIVRQFSPPHVASMKALEQLDATYAAIAANEEAIIKAVQAETYDLWKPQEAAKITTPVPQF